MTNYKSHKYAELFPMATDDELKQMAEDIKQNGLRNEIVLFENEILDGRNRYEACHIAEIEPRFTQYNGNDPLGAVISWNIHRRHLTVSQRAVLALELKPLYEKEAKERQKGGQGGVLLRENFPQGRARDQAAKTVNVSGRTVDDVEYVKKEAPELYEQIKSGKITVHDAKKKTKSKKTKNERSEMAKNGANIKPTDRWKVDIGDIKNYIPTQQYDFIISDPPYSMEYLDLFSVLAEKANIWMKDSGLLAIMCGQSYLDEIYSRMTEHLSYYWTGCYLTPGQPTPLRHRQVNTTWKPILFFTKKGAEYRGKIFGDVYKSDGNDKDFHKWGQSESGMLSLISSVCLPGQSIFDPFLGAGATGVAALKHGCLFHGIDIDPECIGISKSRLSEVK